MTMFQYLVLAQDVVPDVAQDSVGQMDQASGQALWMTYQPLVIGRWIHFASAFVLFGSSFFWFYMPREHSLAHPGQLAKALAATNIMLRIAAPVAAISGVAWLALVLINMTSDFHSVVDPEDLRLFFYETPVGTVSIIRLALLAIAVVVAFLPWHGRDDPGVNDELGLPTFTYIPNPDNSNEYDFNFAYQRRSRTICRFRSLTRSPISPDNPRGLYAASRQNSRATTRLAVPLP